MPYLSDKKQRKLLPRCNTDALIRELRARDYVVLARSTFNLILEDAQEAILKRTDVPT